LQARQEILFCDTQQFRALAALQQQEDENRREKLQHRSVPTLPHGMVGGMSSGATAVERTLAGLRAGSGPL
jgi:hypothetical protein